MQQLHIGTCAPASRHAQNSMSRMLRSQRLRWLSQASVPGGVPCRLPVHARAFFFVSDFDRLGHLGKPVSRLRKLRIPCFRKRLMCLNVPGRAWTCLDVPGRAWTCLKLLAYAGDLLSNYQDQVANESRLRPRRFAMSTVAVVAFLCCWRRHRPGDR